MKALLKQLAVSLGFTVAVLASLWISTSVIFFIINQIKQIL